MNNEEKRALLIPWVPLLPKGHIPLRRVTINGQGSMVKSQGSRATVKGHGQGVRV